MRVAGKREDRSSGGGTACAVPQMCKGAPKEQRRNALEAHMKRRI